MENNPAALVKELQVFQLFVNRIALQQNQDAIGPQRADSRQDSNIQSDKSQDEVKNDDFGRIEEIISKPDLFQMIKGVPRILGFTYTQKIAEIKMESCGDSIQSFMQGPDFAKFTAYRKACIVFDMLR